MGGFLSIVARYPRFCRSGSTDTDIAGSGKTRWRTGHDAGIVWCRVAVCVTKERFGGIPGTCTKPIPVGDIPGIQQADVCQLLPSRIAFPEREEQCATGT